MKIIKGEFNMKSMKLYSGDEIEYANCPSCAFRDHKFSLPCGNLYEDELIYFSQDWELPIDGFIVLAPKRHTEVFSDLTSAEQKVLFERVNEILIYLRQLKIADEFSVIFNDKRGVHFHVWIMPWHEWMKEKFGSPIKNIDKIFDYAKKQLRTKDNIEKIKETYQKLSKLINKGDSNGNI